MKVAIIGYGKMGHEIEQVLLSRGHSVALIIDQDNVHDLCAEKLADVDVAIEFTTPATAYSNVRTCIECGTPVVSCTTGWHEQLAELQELCREKNSTMIWSSNYSLGVNITFRLNRYLAELMNRFNAYNVAI
jgi:4-hydroxy-tetrahydrodipicolinate reductase